MSKQTKQDPWYETARDQALSATFVDLRVLKEIAERRFPQHPLDCIYAMKEALELARAKIRTMSPDDLVHPRPGLQGHLSLPKTGED